jgi:hypothetical protein
LLQGWTKTGYHWLSKSHCQCLLELLLVPSAGAELHGAYVAQRRIDEPGSPLPFDFLSAKQVKATGLPGVHPRLSTRCKFDSN